MKSNILKTSVFSNFMKHKNLYILSFILVIAGLIAGGILALTHPADNNVAVKQYFENFMTSLILQGISKNEVFRLSFYNCLKSFIVISISGLYLWLLPLGSIQLFMCGFKVGFTLLCFIKIFHIKGFLVALLFLLPQTIFFIPAICYLYISKIITLNKSRQVTKNSYSLISKKIFFKTFFVSFLIFWAISFIACITEGYFIPSIIKHVCKFFV